MTSDPSQALQNAISGDGNSSLQNQITSLQERCERIQEEKNIGRGTEYYPR